MNAAAHQAPSSQRSWFEALSARFASQPGDSALVSSVIARGRQTLHGVVVLTPLPRLWVEEDEDDDEITECDHRDPPLLRSDMG